MKEYGTTEIFIADQQQMRAEDGKQEFIWSGLSTGGCTQKPV